MEKQNQRVALSKRMMKEGLLRLLQKKHISKISVSELCQEAEINRTTFYRHYQTPADILLEMTLDYVQAFSIQAQASQCSHDVRSYATQLCVFLRRHSDVVKLFMKNDADLDLTIIFQQLSKAFIGARILLYRGKQLDDATIQLLNSFFFSGTYALIRKWLTEEVPKSPEEVAELLCCSFDVDFSFQ